MGPLAGRRETWGGAGLHPLQKSKAFIKKAINWYQKKTQGGLQEEAEREAGRGTNTVEDRWGGAVQGSWDADTKCISGPPPTPPEADGQRLWPGEAQPSPCRGPHRDGHCLRLPDGKNLQQREEKRLDGDTGAEGTFHLPAQAPLCEAQHEEGPAGDLQPSECPPGVPDQKGRPPSLSPRRKVGWTSPSRGTQDSGAWP